MRHIIEINDSTSAGRKLVEFLLSIHKTTKGIEFLTAEELEVKEDEALLKLMLKAREKGHANTQKVLKKLKVKCK